ncbi:hypothetical protein MASR2M18_02830 [Ignavibacteria bacterium]
MKIYFVLTVIVIIGTVALQGQKLQWKQTNGPNGGYINCLAENADNIYAGTDGMGIYRASAEGKNWTLISEGDVTAWGLAFKGEAMYAGTLKQGIIRTVDGGATWTEINSGIPRKIVDKDILLPAMRTLLNRDNNLFVGTFGYGMFRSDNGGENWTKVAGLPAENIIALTDDGNAILAGTNKGVYRSGDDGASWQAMSNGLPNDAVYGIVKSGSTYFAATYQSGVYRLHDGGTSWRAFNNGLPLLQIWSIESVGSAVYAGTHGNGVYRAVADDTIWTNVKDIGNADVRAFLHTASNIFVGTFTGVWKSGDNGATWEASGLPRTVISSLAFNGKSLFAGIFSGGVSRSDNGGETWKSVNNGTMRTASIVQCMLAKDGYVFAGIYGSDGIYRTDNNGEQWKVANKGLPATTVWSLASSGAAIWAGTTEGVYRSSDNGDNWELSGEGTESLRILSIAVDGQTVYAGTTEGVFKSVNGGATWNPSNTEIEMKNIGALAVCNGNVFAGVTGGGGGVLRSANGGTAWQTIGSFGELLVTCFAVKGNVIFAGTDDGVFFTTDNGEIWTKVNDGIDFVIINAIALHDSKLYAGTVGGGVYSANIETLSASETICGTIDFTVSADGDGLKLQLDTPPMYNVEFVCFDVLGNKIRSVNIPAGTSSARISRIPSGVYFCTVNPSAKNSAQPLLISR